MRCDDTVNIGLCAEKDAADSSLWACFSQTFSSLNAQDLLRQQCRWQKWMCFFCQTSREARTENNVQSWMLQNGCCSQSDALEQIWSQIQGLSDLSLLPVSDCSAFWILWSDLVFLQVMLFEKKKKQKPASQTISQAKMNVLWLFIEYPLQLLK